MELKWERICDALERLSASSARHTRHRILDSLITDARACGDPFSVLRILLPKRDPRRCNLKQPSLAACLIQALGLARTSKDARQLLNWKTSAGALSGDLSLLASQVISARFQQQSTGELSLPEVHGYLDKLASVTLREEQASVLGDLIKRTTANQMKWILRLILQDMRLRVGEKTVLQLFHGDATKVISFCVDLNSLCRQLASPTISYRDQELVVGKPVMCQQSKAVCSLEEAWSKMKGKPVVVECKFDGDRMHLHKDGDDFSFWSRNSLKHDEYQESTIIPILQQRITSKRCVLDGELLVWDSVEERYKSRQYKLNGNTARAERKGWESTDSICYVVFDILYEENYGSLLHLPLHDRHKILKQIIIPDQPRFITILPDEGSKWSTIIRSPRELHEFFNQTIQRGDEGIVIKDLKSQWTPNKRDNRWLKIKPDYLNLGVESDLDLLIIGGYYGKGEKACQLVSYLLAVKDQPNNGEHPSKFLSICRCGVGLGMDEHRAIQLRLEPFLMKNRKGGPPPPNAGYMVTGSPFECPDFWVSHPEKSVILQVKSEKRIYYNFTFKTGYTFRFTRAIKPRFDKNWFDCLAVQEFEDMVATSKSRGNSLVGKCKSLPISNQKKKYGRTGSGTLIPPHLQPHDHSGVIPKGSQFANLVIYFCKPVEIEFLQDFTVKIIEGGGRVAPNLTPPVTHVVSSHSKGVDFTSAVVSGRDVISMDWLQECLNSSQLLTMNSRHYLHLSDASKESQKAKIDSYGDSYFDPVSTQDLAKIFQNIDAQTLTLDMKYLLKLERKHLSSCEWSIFRGVVLFLLPPIHSTNVDSQMIAKLTLSRLSVEASMRGASRVEILDETVTHSICFVSNPTQISFKSIFRSMQGSEELLRQSNSIVSHVWLQDMIQQKSVHPVSKYDLRSGISLDDFTPNKRQRVLESPNGSTFVDLDMESSPQNLKTPECATLNPKPNLDMESSPQNLKTPECATLNPKPNLDMESSPQNLKTPECATLNPKPNLDMESSPQNLKTPECATLNPKPNLDMESSLNLSQRDSVDDVLRILFPSLDSC